MGINAAKQLICRCATCDLHCEQSSGIPKKSSAIEIHLVGVYAFRKEACKVFIAMYYAKLASETLYLFWRIYIA